MIDYQNNVQEFYKRADYAELIGQKVNNSAEVIFKDLTYIPRKTTPFPGVMSGKMLQAFSEIGIKQSTLYVHIPFCNLRCSYCSFYRNPFEAEQVEHYVTTLLAELDTLAAQGVFAKNTIEAVFFGGGTPSVLNVEQITLLLNKIHSVASLSEHCELTFESSIYDLSPEKLAACLAGGINRFSFGVQAFDTKLRRSLGRLNTEAEVQATLELVAKTKAKVIIDLIYVLVGQTQEQLLADIEKAIACGVSGLDLYKLQIMPTSPLGDAIAKGKVQYKHSDKELLEMFLAADNLLAQRAAKPLSCCHWAMRADERSYYNTLVKSGSNIIACGSSCGGRMGAYKYMKLMDRSTYEGAAARGEYPVMAMGRQSVNYVFLEKLSGQCDNGCLDFADLSGNGEWQRLFAPILQHWLALGLLKEVGEKYEFTAVGKFYYRQLDRVLLTAAEYALYGKPGLLEQAGQKMMGAMKNMK